MRKIIDKSITGIIILASIFMVLLGIIGNIGIYFKIIDYSWDNVTIFIMLIVSGVLMGIGIYGDIKKTGIHNRCVGNTTYFKQTGENK